MITTRMHDNDDDDEDDNDDDDDEQNCIVGQQSAYRFHIVSAAFHARTSVTSPVLRRGHGSTHTTNSGLQCDSFS